MKFSVVAKYTFKELVKSKVMVITLWASLILFIAVYVTSEFSYGNPQKIALDFGLGVSSLLSAAIAIFLGGNLVRKEVESRTIYIALSRPIDRFNFLIGKITGMSFILGLNILIINLVGLAVYVFFGGSFDWLILISVLFSFFESFIILLVVILFSLFTNQTISVVNTVVIYVLGHAIPRSLDIHFLVSRPLLLKFVKGYSYIFPNLDKINIRDFVIYKKGLESSFLWGGVGYTLLYSAFLILLSGYIFNKKELD
jgi:ABC-type transport system involved in multi-copper enzyme maturation permease subunit